MYKFDKMILNSLAHPMSNSMTIEETPAGKYHLVFWSDKQEVRIEFDDAEEMLDKLKVLKSIANHAVEWGNIEAIPPEHPDVRPEYKTEF